MIFGMKNRMLFNIIGDVGGDSGGGSGEQNHAENPAPNPNEGWTRPEWSNGLEVDDEMLRSNIFSSIKSTSDIVKGYYHAQKLVGHDKVVVPNEKSTPEQWKAFYERGGLPSKLEDYKTDIPKLYESDEFKNEIYKTAMDNFIKPEQLKSILSIVDKHNNKIADSMDAEEKTKYETTVANLTKEWGTEYGRNIKVINSTLKHLAGDEMYNSIMDSDLADNEHFIKFMHGLAGKLNKEDTFSKDVVRNFNISKEDARIKLNEIRADKESPLYKHGDPRRQDVLKEILMLEEIIAK